MISHDRPTTPGFVTLDELEDVLRRKLEISRAKISADRLLALWCSLDVDDSNQVHADEFSAFIRLYKPARSTVPTFGGVGSQRGAGFSFTRDVAIAATPTTEVRPPHASTKPNDSLVTP